MQINEGRNFTLQEIQYYNPLFDCADSESRGYVDQSAGASFLMTSGLTHETLHAIWGISDAHGQGILTKDRFFVALRLVAHAQAQQPPSRELAAVAPPALPDFRGLQRRRDPSEYSPPPGSRAPSMAGGLSDTSDFEPIIVSSEEQVQRAAEFARQAATSLEGWVPSGRELHRYASLFKKADADNLGFVDHSQARSLTEKSGFDIETFSLAWERADRDGGGRLSFASFVVLMHVASCARRGMRPPGPQEELPREFMRIVVGLLSVDDVLAQYEVNRSPTGSAGCSVRASPAADAWVAEPADPFAMNFAAASSGGFGDFGDLGDFGLSLPFGSPKVGRRSPVSSTKEERRPSGSPCSTRQRTPQASPSASSRRASTGEGSAPLDAMLGFGIEPADDWGCGAAAFPRVQEGEEELTGKQGKKKKKDRNRSRDLLEQPSLSEAWNVLDVEVVPRPSPQSRHAASFGGTLEHKDSFVSERRKDVFNDVVGRELEDVVATFESMLQADSSLTSKLRVEIDALSQELARIGQNADQLRQHIQREEVEEKHMTKQQWKLDTQTKDLRHHVSKLRDSHKAVHAESIVLLRDRRHLAEEHAFLGRAHYEARRTLDSFKRTNAVLERSYKELEAEAEELERQRRATQHQVQEERALVRREAAANVEMRRFLESAMRELETRKAEAAREHLEAVDGEAERGRGHVGQSVSEATYLSHDGKPRARSTDRREEAHNPFEYRNPFRAGPKTEPASERPREALREGVRKGV